MVRRVMTMAAAAALAFGVAVGAAAPAVAQQAELTPLQCFLGGGLPLPGQDGATWQCTGGVHNGKPVQPPALPGS